MTDSPASKKIKTTMEQAPDTEWPEAWLMPAGECKDQKAPNKLEPNVSVSAEELKEIGIKWVEQREMMFGIIIISITCSTSHPLSQ